MTPDQARLVAQILGGRPFADGARTYGVRVATAAGKVVLLSATDLLVYASQAREAAGEEMVHVQLRK